MAIEPLKIRLFGITGGFGKTIAALIEQTPTFQLASPETCSVFLDVTAPAALPNHIDIALSFKKPIVIGTTGLSESDFDLIHRASQSIPIFYAPNFSLGMAILQKLTQETARRFHKNGHLDLIETHHAGKKDAPSGTALLLAKTVQKNSSLPLKIHSLRTGQTVGTHTLLFNSPEEQITLTHEAHSRNAFARGALTASLFLYTQKPGLYNMDDLLA